MMQQSRRFRSRSSLHMALSASGFQELIPILFQEYNYNPEPSDEGMGSGDEERREKMNRGKFAHEFTQIYTNWRLVRPVSPFKTGACLLMGRNFRIVAD
ncbi:hypothetical protein, partial [Chlorobium limicola]|uniref:hypothetical protein n=1 Tax=Chlorobium limicola TaxID=1092 RepID=UPI001F1A473E